MKNHVRHCRSFSPRPANLSSFSFLYQFHTWRYRRNNIPRENDEQLISILAQRWRNWTRYLSKRTALTGFCQTSTLANLSDHDSKRCWVHKFSNPSSLSEHQKFVFLSFSLGMFLIVSQPTQTCAHARHVVFWYLLLNTDISLWLFQTSFKVLKIKKIKRFHTRTESWTVFSLYDDKERLFVCFCV